MTGFRRVTSLISALLCFSTLTLAQYASAAPLQRQTLAHTPAASALERVAITKAPSWVVPHSPKLDASVPTDDIQDGIYYLLSDFQYLFTAADPEQQYRHFAVKLTNTNAADSYSQLNFVFDPAYEQLQLHAVTVHRDGQTLDKLTQADHTIERAPGAEQVIDGSMQLRLLLSDIRVGDVVEFSYSVVGANPVFGGHVYHRRPLQWNVPIAQQQLRIIWQRPTPLQLQITPDADAYHIDQQQLGEQQIYQLALTNTQGMTVPDGVPSWYEPRAHLSFSDLATWQDVAQWGQALFTDAMDVSEPVATEAKRLAKGLTTPEQRLVAALDFVQTQIRYLALEMGVNSHLPAKADMTLRHRFGDCKDKSALLVALLQAMDIKAFPVLVDTERGAQLNMSLPSAKVFNHAVVMVDLDGQQVFVDPTIGVQKGPLAQRQVPDYGYALVLADNSQALVKMPSPTNTLIDYKEEFDLRRGAGHPASYQVQTRYLGAEAEKLRQRLATGGVADLQRSYKDFFTEQYGALTVSPLTIDDSGNGVAIREQYQLDNPWQTHDDAEQSFYISENQISLQQPKNREPRPFALKYPQTVNGEITLKLNDDIDWSFANESHQEQNRFFDYRFAVNFDKAQNQLVLNYHYQTLVAYVPEQQFAEYLAAVDRVADYSEFGIASYPPEPPLVQELPPKKTGKVLLGTLYVLLALVLLGVALAKWLSVKRPLRHTVFYPTSVKHTLLLMWLTGGVYGVYWCYRNWCYWRAQQQNAPQHRWLGILLPIIYLPLTLKVAQQVSERHWLLRLSGVLTPLVVCLLLWQMGHTVLIIGWLILFVLLIPLVMAVNQLNWQQGIAVPARWRTYHSLTAFALAPGYLWWLAS
ncbi:DUF3857 domain-containing transglutaminase family protein [Shewanella sp. A3A]|nr:DUF3857 domain-containing transglutaminase family protein [Shewanella ferrihydritica]